MSAKCIFFIGFVLAILNTTVEAQSYNLENLARERAKATFLSEGLSDRTWRVNAGWTRVAERFQSHYNTKIAKCLILIETVDTNGVVSDSNSSLRSGDLSSELQHKFNQAKWWNTAPYASFHTYNGKVSNLSTYASEKQNVPGHFVSHEQFNEFVANFMDTPIHR